MAHWTTSTSTNDLVEPGLPVHRVGKISGAPRLSVGLLWVPHDRREDMDQAALEDEEPDERPPALHAEVAVLLRVGRWVGQVETRRGRTSGHPRDDTAQNTDGTRPHGRCGTPAAVRRPVRSHSDRPIRTVRTYEVGVSSRCPAVPMSVTLRLHPVAATPIGLPSAAMGDAFSPCATTGGDQHPSLSRRWLPLGGWPAGSPRL